MKISLENKTVFITGGSRGIGAATTIAAAKAGAKNVIITYHSQRDAAIKVVTEVTALGANALALQMSAANLTSIETCIATVIQQFGRIDVLVNNAGELLRRNFFNTTSNDLDRLYYCNLRAPIVTTQLVVKHMNEINMPCVVINVTSDRDTTVTNQTMAYQIMKAGLHMFTKVAANDTAPLTRVITIAPGMITTDIHRDLWQDNPKKWREKCDNLPLKRAGEPEEVANMIVFYASDLAQTVTGTRVVAADGGRGVIENHVTAPELRARL